MWGEVGVGWANNGHLKLHTQILRDGTVQLPLQVYQVGTCMLDYSMISMYVFVCFLGRLKTVLSVCVVVRALNCLR